MENGMPSVDELIQQRDKQSAQQLQQQFGQAKSVIDQESNYGRQAIMDQYRIADKEQRRQYNAERDPKRKAAIKERMYGTVAQYEGKLKALDNKFLPDRQRLESAMKTETQKMQQANAQRDFRLQTVRQLVQMGTITDPALAKQAEYKALGIDIPISALRPRTPDPQKRKNELVSNIRNMDNILERFTPGDIDSWFSKNPKLLDEITQKTRTLDPDNGDDAIIINDMRKLASQKKQDEAELQELFLQVPAYRQAIQGQQERRAAADMFLPKNSAEKGGGIGPSITNQIAKQNKGKQTGKPIIQRNRTTNQIRTSYDGGKTWQRE